MSALKLDILTDDVKPLTSSCAGTNARLSCVLLAEKALTVTWMFDVLFHRYSLMATKEMATTRKPPARMTPRRKLRRWMCQKDGSSSTSDVLAYTVVLSVE